MSKLFKLKKWLLLSDAASYLSATLNEPVRESDILQLALDGQLTISLHIHEAVYGKRGQLVTLANVRKAAGLPIKGMPPYEVPLGIRLNDDFFLDFHGAPVQTLEGIYDLPMLGGEVISVQKEFQRLTGGLPGELTNIDGTFIREVDVWSGEVGDYFQVLDYLEEKKSWKDLQWFPVGKLPQNSQFVVRTSALTDFLRNIEAAENEATEKPLAKRERETLLAIIAALCKYAGLDYSRHAKTAAVVQSAAAEMGVSIGETTIEVHLKKISDALGTRMK